MKQKFYLLAGFLAVMTTSVGAERPAPFSVAVGTQTIGIRYQFTDEAALVETAKEIQKLGADTLKFSLTPKYADENRMEAVEGVNTLLELVSKQQAFRQVMDMPFRNFMIWVYPFADRKSAFYQGEIPPAEAEAIYREIYDFTAYLLTQYSGSGKSFFLGNWEGDWHTLKEVYDYDLDPDPATIEATKEWFRIREKAVSDARRNVPHDDVEVYFYIELNHVRKSMDADRPTIVNAILPHIKTDFVSWSSYDIISESMMELDPREARQRMMDALNYIERHLPPSDIPGKRVFIGEYGFPISRVGEAELQRSYSAAVMKWALEWGCPFILYWELYCNEIEPKTGEHRGFWLIDDQGIKQPAWFLHRNFLERAQAFVTGYEAAHGELPPQATYNREAASWIEPFASWKVAPSSP